MRFTAAVRDTTSGGEDPKIQIWREDKSQPGVYYKKRYDIPISSTTSPCYQRINLNADSGIFQCILQEYFHISVQPGDFLGLEIPHWHHPIEIYFKSGGPTSLVFRGQLRSTVNLFTRSHTISNDEPQITFLVVLGKEFMY